MMEDVYDMEMDFEDDEADDEYDAGEIDDMLDALVEAAEDESDLAERKRRRRKRKPGKVTRARGGSAYRSQVSEKYVTQKQLKDALGRVGVDVRRNAQGIKTVNDRVGKVDTRVDGVVEVNKVQSRHIGKLEHQMKIDGALELVQSYNPETQSIELFQVLKGAVKSGFLADSKGAASNPYVLGAVGLVLRNPAILGGLLGGAK